LFVDGINHTSAVEMEKVFQLPVVNRCPRIRTVGNWILALYELYLREPNADRYAVFQDDFVCYRNLRQYIEKCPYPEKGYLNLYTFPSNHPQKLRAFGLKAPADNYVGWYESNQNGRGAVALIFNKDAVRTLLCAQHLVDKVMDVHHGHVKIDGGVLDSMRKAGWKEYVHQPSLVQHVGLLSSMGNGIHAQAPTFQGEEVDALTFLPACKPVGV
jgi:hypothetical protein